MANTGRETPTANCNSGLKNENQNAASIQQKNKQIK